MEEQEQDSRGDSHLSNDEEDLTLLTESMMSHSFSNKADPIKDFTFTLKSSQDLFDYEKVLNRDDQKRKAFAIRDIILSHRIPFSTTKEEFYKNKEYDHPLLEKTVFQPLPTQSMTLLPPVIRSSSRKRAQERANQQKFAPLRAKKEKKLPPQVTKVKVVTYAQLEQSAEDKFINQKLQVVLEILNRAKTDVNSTQLYVTAAKLFYDLNFYDRAIYCYQRAIEQNRPDLIIDTNYLPNSIQYQRKLERMSEFHKKDFLIRREQLRQQYIYEETERQRLRARFANCQLFYLYSLILSVQDLWKAFDHLQRAFALCKDDIEHIELLRYFHYQLKALSDLMNGKPEFDSSRQIIQAMAGPTSEAHLNILLELESLDPENPEIQDWLGIRYTEKCDFESALLHYKRGRDLRVEKPSMEDVLALWKTPVNGETFEDKESKERIRKNTNKNRITEYNTVSAVGMEIKQREKLPRNETIQKGSEDKDHTWFMGCHKEANTIIYMPPLQGWHVD